MHNEKTLYCRNMCTHTYLSRTPQKSASLKCTFRLPPSAAVRAPSPRRGRGSVRQNGARAAAVIGEGIGADQHHCDRPAEGERADRRPQGAGCCFGDDSLRAGQAFGGCGAADRVSHEAARGEGRVSDEGVQRPEHAPRLLHRGVPALAADNRHAADQDMEMGER